MAPALRTSREGPSLPLWDTNGAEVVRRLAAERRNAGGVTSGLALNLIVVTAQSSVRAVEDAVTIAAADPTVTPSSPAIVASDVATTV